MVSELPGFPTFQLVNLREQRDQQLLQEFCTELYMPAFPIESEREDPELWKPRLWGDAPLPFEFHLLIAGTDLAHAPTRKLVAGVVFELYHQSACALVTYIVVHPDARQRGLAQALLDSARHVLQERAAAGGRSLRAIFAEVNDPRLVSAERDSMDPWQRLAIMERLGARIVAIPYVQPALGPDQDRADELLLVTFPVDGTPRETIERRTVAAFLEDFYTALGVEDLDGDPDLTRARSAMREEQIPLLRLAAP
jgi:GNAT superfamily N-acetyltransferase